MATSDEILHVLDHGARSFVFPVLDNGYVYLAATRVSLHRSDADWALVFEVFGFSPRAGLPDLCVCTFGSRLRDRDPPEKYVSREAHSNYLVQHPNEDSRFFHPIAEGDWQDSESDEVVATDARTLLLRDLIAEIPAASAFMDFDITLCDAPQVQTFELCRLLAAQHRDLVLATPTERRVSVPDELAQILVLDEWRHPDLLNGERPSEAEAFVQLADVLSSGNLKRYVPTAMPNTHWRFWPDGGTL
jgi:hypothetical protein